MGTARFRAAAIALFAAAALLVGIGNSSHRRLLVALAFACFALGVVCFLRWRRTLRANVFDREEKTPE
jgi:Flp pilus assembly protein TadB